VFAQRRNPKHNHDRKECTEANTYAAPRSNLFDGGCAARAIDGSSIREEENVENAIDEVAARRGVRERSVFIDC